MDELNFIVIFLSLVNLILLGSIFFLYTRYLNANNQKIRLESILEAERQKQAEINDLKNDSLAATKAAIFEISHQVSDNLLNMHKNEQKTLSESNSKILNEVTKKLNDDVLNITKSVAYLSEKVKDSGSQVDMIKKALLAPSYVGYTSETTLENILKSMGLIPNIDYFIQLTVNSEEGKMRPDAIVMLPGNNVMVIDSKASKHFFEMYQDNASAIEKEKFIASMNNHLKQLSSKDYTEFVKKYLDKNIQNHKTEHISLLMFMPSETMLEKLTENDKTFYTRSWDLNVFPVGPSGLVNILSHAKFVIAESKKAEYAEHIISEVNKIISSVATVIDYSKKIGSNIKNLAVNYDKMAASINGNLLQKVKRIKSYGVGNSEEIAKVERYQLINNDLNEIDITETQDA